MFAVGLSGTTLACGGSSEAAPAGQSDAADVAPDAETSSDAPAETATLLDHFDLHVDPNGSSVLTVSRVSGSSPSGALTNDAELTGTATWNADTHVVTAQLHIVNRGTWNWDEPAIRVVAITTDATQLQVQEGSGRPGTFGGSGGVGSMWELADVEAAGKHASASQTIAIYDPESKPATISVDIVAVRTSAVVSPDKDGDGWNTEIGGAGNDCDDADPTRYPDGPGCTCASACPRPDGTVACAAGGCCGETLSKPGEKRTCSPGCNCDFVAESTGDNTISCAEGSVCRVFATNQTSTLDLCSGATCDVECTGSTSTAKCTIARCEHASCAVFAGGSVRTEIAACSDSSTCVVGCAPGAECHLTCKDEGSDCRMMNCAADNCFLECPGGKSTNCGNIKVCGGPERC